MTYGIEDLNGTFYAAFSGKPELIHDLVTDDWDGFCWALARQLGGSAPHR
ncbi:hypothetical protein [Streptomyces werraensis]